MRFKSFIDTRNAKKLSEMKHKDAVLSSLCLRFDAPHRKRYGVSEGSCMLMCVSWTIHHHPLLLPILCTVSNQPFIHCYVCGVFGFSSFPFIRVPPAWLNSWDVWVPVGVVSVRNFWLLSEMLTANERRNAPQPTGDPEKPSVSEAV